ncbi:HPr kinase/phosphatase C-terminal domain-containing protein [Loktanella sp. SALINAS62]|uniref:HPr kinase/phosphorylase n=1 Tax=Loktanella sp. SALINAS62 TaxID=2706124 RepID=UPI001B8D11B4|nr:HPr kinase/phosphatase C-terminal domain-containing protein [Loktanella sp. SALINAS62]MBS1302195.1 serine kinase [Loktanella sp. SALINAS62]
MADDIVHASCVAAHGRAILIIGPSGSGKSALALQLMALGAMLVADDRTILSKRGGVLTASCPDTLSGLIEARGIGILTAVVAQPTPVAYIVDMETAEPDRLPPVRHYTLMGLPIPLIYRSDGVGFASSLMLLLQGGRHA